MKVRVKKGVYWRRHFPGVEIDIEKSVYESNKHCFEIVGKTPVVEEEKHVVAEEEPVTETEYEEMKKADLVEKCEEFGLDTEGTKSDLIDRLNNYAPSEE